MRYCPFFCLFRFNPEMEVKLQFKRGFGSFTTVVPYNEENNIILLCSRLV